MQQQQEQQQTRTVLLSFPSLNMLSMHLQSTVPEVMTHDVEMLKHVIFMITFIN